MDQQCSRLPLRVADAVPMPFELYAALAGIVLLYLIAMEAAKRTLHARFALQLTRAH
jgi:hypothetical protein